MLILKVKNQISNFNQNIKNMVTVKKETKDSSNKKISKNKKMAR